jgi:hypothetical protein
MLFALGTYLGTMGHMNGQNITRTQIKLLVQTVRGSMFT